MLGRITGRSGRAAPPFDESKRRVPRRNAHSPIYDRHVCRMLVRTSCYTLVIPIESLSPYSEIILESGLFRQHSVYVGYGVPDALIEIHFEFSHSFDAFYGFIERDEVADIFFVRDIHNVGGIAAIFEFLFDSIDGQRFRLCRIGNFPSVFRFVFFYSKGVLRKVFLGDILFVWTEIRFKIPDVYRRHRISEVIFLFEKVPLITISVRFKVVVFIGNDYVFNLTGVGINLSPNDHTTLSESL